MAEQKGRFRGVGRADRNLQIKIGDGRAAQKSGGSAARIWEEATDTAVWPPSVPQASFRLFFRLSGFLFSFFFAARGFFRAGAGKWSGIEKIPDQKLRPGIL
jgi:hypothetical protein